MQDFDGKIRARKFDRYGGEISATVGTPGRSTVTSRMPATARAIARAVAAEMRDQARDADALVTQAADGPGHALPGELRALFETSLGTDLGDVRVHTDSAASAASAGLGARAYALGQDVYMAEGQYAPHTTEGAFLLAHEVAHVVQQRGSNADPQCKLEVSEPGDASELEADRAASAMVGGAPFSISSASSGARSVLRRWVDPGLANEIIRLICAADLPTIQQIILGIETARADASAGQGQVQLRIPGMNTLVPVGDLCLLDTRARARFRELHDQPAASSAPRSAPSAPRSGPAPVPQSAPVPEPSSEARSEAVPPQPEGDDQSIALPPLPAFRYSLPSIPLSIQPIEVPGATIVFSLSLRGNITATPPRPMPGVSLDQNGLRLEADQRIEQLTSGLRLSSIGSGNATIGSTLSGPFNSTEWRFTPPSTYSYICQASPVTFDVGEWTIVGTLGWELTATVVPHPNMHQLVAVDERVPLHMGDGEVLAPSWWDRNGSYVIGTVVVVGLVAVALTGVGAVAEGGIGAVAAAEAAAAATEAGAAATGTGAGALSLAPLAL